MVYDSTAASFAFAPRWNAGAFKCFVSAHGGWGTFAQTGAPGGGAATAALAVLHGSGVAVRVLDLSASYPKANTVRAELEGKSVSADVSGGVVSFGAAVTVPAGSTLTVTLGSSGIAVVVPEKEDGLRRRRGGGCGCEGGKCAPAKPSGDDRGGSGQRVQQAIVLLLAAFLLFTLGVYAGGLWFKERE